MKTTPPIETVNASQSLLDALREQKGITLKGGIYHKTQIDLTYNSNHIEGSRLTYEQILLQRTSRMGSPRWLPDRHLPYGTRPIQGCARLFQIKYLR